MNLFFIDSKPKQESSTSLFDLKRIKDLMLTPGVGFIYLIKLISGLPFGIFQSMFALVVVNTFGLTPAQHGMFMSYIGALMIVSTTYQYVMWQVRPVSDGVLFMCRT
jgi:OCT family organic cation transporter-like MFS transporter 18